MAGDTTHDFSIAANYWNKAQVARQSLNKESTYTLEQGINEIITGDLKLAHQALDRAEIAGEVASDVRMLRGALFFEEGNVLEQGSLIEGGGRGKNYAEQAIEAYRKSIKLNPEAEAYYMLGSMLVETKRIEEAKEAFQSAVELHDGEASIEAQAEIDRINKQYPHKSEDLEAINLLSEQFSDALERVAPYGNGDSIVIPTNIESRGLKILRMYEAEATNAPDDVEVKVASSIHM